METCLNCDELKREVERLKGERDMWRTSHQETQDELVTTEKSLRAQLEAAKRQLAVMRAAVEKMPHDTYTGVVSGVQIHSDDCARCKALAEADKLEGEG